MSKADRILEILKNRKPTEKPAMSPTELATKLGVRNSNTVSGPLKTLVKKGLLKREQGAHGRAFYRLNVELAPKLDVEPVAQLAL